MSAAGRITGWLELLDASEILEAKRVNDLINDLGSDDENWESEPMGWNSDFTLPMQYEVVYWRDKMPDVALMLDNVAELLCTSEYLLFEEKTRRALNDENSYRMILVTKDNVQYLPGSIFQDKFREKINEVAEASKGRVDELDVG